MDRTWRCGPAALYRTDLQATKGSQRLTDQGRSPTMQPPSRGGAVVARRAHNPKVGGSNPSPATNSAFQIAEPPPARRLSRYPGPGADGRGARSARWNGTSTTTVFGRKKSRTLSRNAVWLWSGNSHRWRGTNSASP